MDDYFSQPWAFLQRLGQGTSSGSQKSDFNESQWWWLDLLLQNNNKLPARHDFEIVQRFRATILSFSSSIDQWTLRLIIGNHPLVALHSWSLVLARAKGICSRDPKETGNPPEIERSVTPISGGSKSPSRTPSPYPSPSTNNSNLRKGAVIKLRAFESGPSGLVASHEYFELEDGEGLSEKIVAELGQVLDLIELMRIPLLLFPDPTHFSQTVSFLFDLVERPEGKNQRLMMQNIVMRSIAVLAFFLTINVERTRKSILESFQGNGERAVGAVARVAYYNPGANIVVWLKDQLMNETFNGSGGENSYLIQLISGIPRPDQIKFTVPGDYEKAYRMICLQSHLVFALEDDILARLDAGETDSHFVSIALSLAYSQLRSFSIIAGALERWKAKMRVKNDRVDAYLQAVAQLQS